MSDQRNNAGNIGDVIKHALLPELIFAAIEGRSAEVTTHYFETHAGFYDYPQSVLTRADGGWSGARAWSLGVALDHLRSGGSLSLYGDVLMRELESKPFRYPGSLKVLERAGAMRRRVRLHGFDLLKDAVRSFPSSFQLSIGDGYAGVDAAIGQLPSESRALVFIDPFWNQDSSGDIHQIERIRAHGVPVAVWYPLRSRSSHWREALRRSGFEAIELRHEHYTVGEGAWAAQDLAGAAIAHAGFPDTARAVVCKQVNRLLHAFRGKRIGVRRLDLVSTVFFPEPSVPSGQDGNGFQ